MGGLGAESPEKRALGAVVELLAGHFTEDGKMPRAPIRLGSKLK